MQVSRHMTADGGNALRRFIALALALGAAGLIGCGAFAIGHSIGGSNAYGAALAAIVALPLFSPLLSLFSNPHQAHRRTGDRGRRLRSVFSRHC
jgi:hypothetical protein